MLKTLPKDLRCLTVEQFGPCVGDVFEVDSRPVPVQLRLDRLIKLQHGPGFLTREPFTLFWSTPANVNMTLGIYRLRNGVWGPHEIYIEPMLSAGERRTYQSVFF